MIKIKDSIKAIKFTGSSKSKDLLVKVFKDSDITFLGRRTNPIVKKPSLMYISHEYPMCISEIVKGDYALISSENKLLAVLDEEYFNTLFEEVKWLWLDNML